MSASTTHSALAAQIIPERLAAVTALLAGGHRPNEDGAMCAMEAAAYVAGEPWSDHPACVCPVIGAFMRTWNDGLPDADRTRLLLPLIPKIIGTRSSAALETRRANMAADWFIRVHTPAWLDLAGLTAQAELLRSFPEITDFTKCPSLMPALTAIKSDAAATRAAARDAAWAAARDAAWAAARDAAWAATRDAARAAARDAARAAAWAAARDAARAAAWDAAWDAARDAAWAAARDAAWAAAWAATRDAARDAAWAAARAKLNETVKTLQASALDLVERMAAIRDEQQKDA